MVDTRQQSQRRRGGRTTSIFCGGQSRGAPTYANAVTAVTSQAIKRANYVVTDHGRNTMSGLLDDQWKSVVAILNVGKHGSAEHLTGMSSNFSWILDTRATHHMTNCLHVLSEL